MIFCKKGGESMAFTFTCPLDGCNHTVMESDAVDANVAAEDLTATAEQHLKEAHPDVQKTHEEVDQDIRAHMTQQ